MNEGNNKKDTSIKLSGTQKDSGVLLGAILAGWVLLSIVVLVCGLIY